jgi:hypothetical protein
MADITKGPGREILEIRNQIRLRLGDGGAQFPGSTDLARAANAIDDWEAEAMSPKAPLEPVSLADAGKVRRALEQIREDISRTWMEIARLEGDIGFMAWAFSNQGGLTSEEHERVRRLSKDYSDMRIPWEPVTGR